MSPTQPNDQQASCWQCGAQLAPDSVFCEVCGVKVAAPEEPAATPPRGLPPVRPTDTTYREGVRTGVFAHQSSVVAEQEPLVGAPSPNQTYLGNRLSYRDVLTNFDPLSNAAYQHALFSRLLGTVAAWLVASSALTLVFGLALLSQLGDSPGSSLLGVLTFLSVALSIVLACLFWLRPLNAQLTEWNLTVDGRASAARAALDHMYAIITTRRSPIRSFRVVRLRPARQEDREYLRLDDDIFTGFVSSFAYGTDLYIGWTFWINMSPARWLWLHVLRLLGAKGSGIYGTLVYDQPKAMRELIHSAVRQGVDMATGEAAPLGQGSVANSATVENVSL